MKFYWHTHHKVLLEPAIKPIEKRIEFIKFNKPAHEIETRLRLLKPVKGELPKEVVDAGKSYSKAWKARIKATETFNEEREAYNKIVVIDTCALGKAWKTFDKAEEAFHKTLADHQSEIEALHKAECLDCPWNGETIFPE